MTMAETPALSAQRANSQYLLGKGQVFHKGGTLMISYHLRHRTPHIDIQDIEIVFYALCHLRHNFRIRPEKLHCPKAGLPSFFQKRIRILISIKNCLRGNHLRTGKTHSHLFAKKAVGKIRYPRHRRHQNISRKFACADSDRMK